jgi:hypothetical protein
MLMFFFIVPLISIQNSFLVIKTLYIYTHLFISRATPLIDFAIFQTFDE